MLVRVALFVGLMMSEVSVDARNGRVSPPIAASLSAVPHLPFSVTAPDEADAADQWMLDPIAADYEAENPNGFRLRMRGAKVKMRMPLDLR